MPLRAIFETALSVLFPETCVSCGVRISAQSKCLPLCERCFERIPRQEHLVCLTCRRRVRELRSRCHPTPGATLLAATEYTAPAARELVKALKYRGRRCATAPLAALIAERLVALPADETAPNPFLLIPLPLHRSRERRRGFNQSFLIAEKLIRLVPNAFELAPKLLQRTRDVRSQTEIRTVAGRRENAAGSFAVTDPTRIDGRAVALLDDVCTSGATALEAARVLRAAGARTVTVIVAAAAQMR